LSYSVKIKNKIKITAQEDSIDYPGQGAEQGMEQQRRK
jgi:hypothetical protein